MYLWIFSFVIDFSQMFIALLGSGVLSFPRVWTQTWRADLWEGPDNNWLAVRELSEESLWLRKQPYSICLPGVQNGYKSGGVPKYKSI